ncbi:site-specific integrase [Rhodococcus qingshengii]|jgi:integrase/recombinase XerD|uniref:site-specific integrase n=1 Tax=Rhodococcus qingshengii TaxID=334542 RepID=UPI0021B12223|nr:site-specific integrase [Rhodococcus qingshengii]MCT6733814.1 site-specific integrase [Rhodococcus qingshengii]MCY4669929.1 site-specific integrase [Rhodococcus sp. (in: high G+C Gram-positive bacteria)]
MLVVKVLSPHSPRESFTVLGDDDVPVAPVERYLKYLTDIERSPNTIKAYAHDLKDWFTFLAGREREWQSVTVEDVGAFVAWLRLPKTLRQDGIAVLPSVDHHCGEATVNRKLSALAAFYLHAVREGVDVGELLTTWQIGGSRAGWKPFLHHISKDMPRPRRAVSLTVPKKLPRVLTPVEVQALLDACDRLRDRFLLALLYDTGMRIGEALGLRHGDIAAAERQITVLRRDNDNRARAKSATPRTVPVSPELIRLYADYLHSEYGDLDSDYVFVNLWGRPRGHPLTYGAVYDLVRRLRRRTSTDFDPHWLRHTAATRMLRDGISLEVVAKLLGHSNVTVTAATYGHLTIEDARKAMEQSGWFTGTAQVRL